MSGRALVLREDALHLPLPDESGRPDRQQWGGVTLNLENAGHGFRCGGRDLDEQLVHGAECGECHDFLRGMSADRCCEWHFARKYGVPGWEQYRARRAELLNNRPEVRGL